MDIAIGCVIGFFILSAFLFTIAFIDLAKIRKETKSNCKSSWVSRLIPKHFRRRPSEKERILSDAEREVRRLVEWFNAD